MANTIFPNIFHSGPESTPAGIDTTIGTIVHGYVRKRCIASIRNVYSISQADSPSVDRPLVVYQISDDASPGNLLPGSYDKSRAGVVYQTIGMV